MTFENPVLVALDFSGAEEAFRMARLVMPSVGGFKIGLSLLMGPGPAAVAPLASLDKPIFVDAKLHDIPSVVRASAEQLGRLGARWVTAHAVGGLGMLKAANEGLEVGSGGREAGVLGVTSLTSSRDEELARVGIPGGTGRQTARLARIASEAGCEGVVCAGKDIGVVAQVASDLIRVVPGIRPAGTSSDDQVHVMTPAEAVSRGADLLVVGRAITKADDPRRAAEEIAGEVRRVRGAH